MTNSTDVWKLLVTREGTWVSRAEIEFVGGVEGMRRLRELRGTVHSQGYTLQQRPCMADNRTLEYRLAKMNVEIAAPEGRWQCVKCGSRPAVGTQPSVDPRWRIGRCLTCRRGDATFERITS